MKIKQILLLSMTIFASDVLAARSAPSQEEYYSTAAKNISPKMRKEADKIRVKTIDSIKILLARKKTKGSKRFELLLRKGELHAERHDFLRDQEVYEFNTSFDAWVAKGKKGREPRISHKRSKNELLKATETFRNLVNRYPKHPRSAAALYALGKSLARLGSDSAPIYFGKIIKYHKKSSYVPDAHLSLGEYYFEKHKINPAIANYKKMLRYKNHPSYIYAVYKLGWAHFNAPSKNKKEEQKSLRKSTASFKLVVKLAEKQKIRRLNLREEALKDLVMVWSESEDTNSAWAYFQNVGAKDKFYDLIERLGKTYEQQGKFAKATQMFERLVKEAPIRKENYEIYARLTNLYDRQGKIDTVVKNLIKMSGFFLVSGSSDWLDAHDKNNDVMSDAEEKVEFQLHRYSTLYHTRGLKSKSKRMQLAAMKLYEKHLTSFPKSSKKWEITYYYADLKYIFKQYVVAADNYFAVAKSPSKKFKKDAALNTVSSLNDQDKIEKYPKLAKAGSLKQPVKLPRIKEKLVGALDFYSKSYPKDKQSMPMRYTAAKTYFDYGHYDAASKRFNAIIDSHPRTLQARSGVQILVGFHAENKRWDKTIELSRKYGTNKKLTNKKLRSYLTAMRQKAMYNKALAFESTKKYVDAANAFLSYEKEFFWDKKSADRALYNAALNFFKAAKLEDAIAAQTKLINKYPNSKVIRESILSVAQTYEALGKFSDAAKYYKRFAYTFPKNKLASKSLYNAATLYKGIGKNKNAVTLFRRFVTYYPRNSLKADSIFDIAALEEKIGHIKKAKISYIDAENSLRSKNPDKSYLAAVKAALLSGSSKESNLRKIKRKLARKSAPQALEARRLIAQYEFGKIEGSYISFNKMSVKENKQIEKQILAKQKRLESLAKRYQNVIDIGSGEYSVASLFRLGQMHENFANVLVTAPAPSGLNAAEKEQFRGSIEKVAFPLKDQAYKYFETAFQRSSEVETFSEWTRRTYDKMVALAPDKNPEVTEETAEPAYMVHRVSLAQ